MIHVSMMPVSMMRVAIRMKHVSMMHACVMHVKNGDERTNQPTNKAILEVGYIVCVIDCVYTLHLGRCLQAVGWIIGLQSPPARSSGPGCPEPLIQPGRRCRHFVISQCLHQHPQIHKYKYNGFINTPKYTNTYTNTFV